MAVFGLQTVSGATLEKLTVEQMAEKSTLIVRGRVTGCTGESQGSMIFTRCTATVSETWKGSGSPNVSFLTPGGTFRGLVQTFVGTPSMNSGEEYVLFLWAGRSRRYQIIGLSQGVFDIALAPGGPAKANRAAAKETMLDSTGRVIADEAVSTTVDALRARVRKAIATAGAAK